MADESKTVPGGGAGAKQGGGGRRAQARARAKRREAPAGVLRACGVRPRAGEDEAAALRRHAAQEEWREATLARWMVRLLRATHGAEKTRLESAANAAFDDLARMNAWLAKLGGEQQKTSAEARKALGLVHINIYDLVAGRFELRHATVAALARDARARDLFFPRAAAKAEGLRAFLRLLRFPRAAAD